jgi:hypothetical protein
MKRLIFWVWDNEFFLVLEVIILEVPYIVFGNFYWIWQHKIKPVLYTYIQEIDKVLLLTQPI